MSISEAPCPRRDDHEAHVWLGQWGRRHQCSGLLASTDNRDVIRARLGFLAHNGALYGSFEEQHYAGVNEDICDLLIAEDRLYQEAVGTA